MLEEYLQDMISLGFFLRQAIPRYELEVTLGRSSSVLVTPVGNAYLFSICFSKCLRITLIYPDWPRVSHMPTREPVLNQEHGILSLAMPESHEQPGTQRMVL